ncbi:MAG TPA: 3'-5' exonuclease [Saprospiraceae bacterium]|nr:3'-5' exonuclease [Saprospiraceae bacterium]HRK83485.1 3'-5' exonuclease [Saprospiraceae bacterium]
MNFLQRLFSKPDYPEFWQRYLDAMQPPLSGNTPLREVTFAVFDTETTGLNPAKDKILSIGGVKVCQNEIHISHSIEIYLEQEAAPQQQDIAIHGIIPAAQAWQQSSVQAVPSFVEWCGPAILTGHHVAFDVAIINQALQRQVGAQLRNRSVDTLQLAMRAQGKSEHAAPGEWTLDRLASLYNIPVHDRHTAAGDAFITAILLMKLLHLLEKRGVKTLGQLLNYRSL